LYGSGKIVVGKFIVSIIIMMRVRVIQMKEIQSAQMRGNVISYPELMTRSLSQVHLMLQSLKMNWQPSQHSAIETLFSIMIVERFVSATEGIRHFASPAKTLFCCESVKPEARLLAVWLRRLDGDQEFFDLDAGSE
jgi:hypothetical protein